MIYIISVKFLKIYPKNFKVKDLLLSLRKLDKKFPELDMTKDIDIAESYITM